MGRGGQIQIHVFGNATVRPGRASDIKAYKFIWIPVGHHGIGNRHIRYRGFFDAFIIVVVTIQPKPSSEGSYGGEIYYPLQPFSNWGRTIKGHGVGDKTGVLAIVEGMSGQSARAVRHGYNSRL